MRTNERKNFFFLEKIMSVSFQKTISESPLIKVLPYFFLLACFFCVNTYANHDFSNVDQALPTLVRGGEVMNKSRQWYRAHSKKGSYISNFSANGRLLALTSQKNPVEVWDTRKRKLVATFSGSGLPDEKAFVDISPDGKFIAMNVGERIEIRKMSTKLLEFSVPAVSGGAATFSPDSHWFATAIDGKRLDLWDMRTKKRESSLIAHKQTISSLGFSFNGKYLVSGDVSGIFNVWDTESKELLYQYSEHKAPLTTVAFSGVGNQFVTIDDSGKVMLWNAEDKKLLQTFKTPKVMTKNTAASFAPDGKTLAVSLNNSDGKSYILLLSTLIGGKPLLSYESNESEINNIAFRSDNKTLVVSFSSKTIKLFDIPGKQFVDAFGGQILKANKTRVSPDGNVIATGTVDGYVQLWDAHKKVLKYSLKGRNRSIENVSFSPDGQYIIAGDKRGAITVWERNTNNRVFFINAHKRGSAIGVMSGDNQYLVTASSESSVIKVWDVQNNKSMFKLIGHHDDITGLAYSPDGQFIASSSKDGTIKLWNIRSKSLEQSFIGSGKTKAFMSLAFSPDGRYLAGGTDQGIEDRHVIEIWDAQAQKHWRTFSKHEAAVTSVRFSADGKQLVTGSADGAIIVWNVSSGESLHQFMTEGEKKTIHSVDFTKDGKNVLSVTSDGVTNVWNLKKNRKAYTLLGGPRGTWVSENHIKKRFMRGDDGSLVVKTSNNMPPAPLAPKGLASKDKLLLTASRRPVEITKQGGKFSITIKNIGRKPSFWLQAKQLDAGKSPVTLLSDKITRLDAGRRGVLDLQLIPHDFASHPLPNSKRKLYLKMEVITEAGSHFPIVIPLVFKTPVGNVRTSQK